MMRILAVIGMFSLAALMAACDDPDPTLQPTVMPTTAVTIPTLQPTAAPTTAVTVPTLQPAATPSHNAVIPRPTLAPLPTATPEPEAGATSEEITEISWSDCGPIIECGEMSVPADYREPELGSIVIQLVVHRATSADERTGYLFVNPGGPGTSAIDSLLEGSFTFSDEIIEGFDIVAMDPRGVGYSWPQFACGEPGEQHALLAGIEMPIDTPQEILAGEAAADLCIQSMGLVGGRLHTEYVARDMEEVRKALDADEIYYLGAGYGSTLGVWYATLFPQSVKAMVLDSADNPGDPASTRQERIDKIVEELASLEAGLEAALEACYDPRHCPIYNDGDPIGYFKQVAGKLELVSAVLDDYPLAGPLGVISALYHEASWPGLWYGLHHLHEDDDPTTLVQFALEQIDGLGQPSLTEHINCLDAWALSSLDRKAALEESEILYDIIQERLPLLASMPIVAPDVCNFYDRFAPNAFEGPLDGGGAPILVIGNPSDPISSFAESEALASGTLSNGYLVEVSHPDHLVYPDNQCVNDHVHRALLELAFPAERRVICEEETQRTDGDPWFECSPTLQCRLVSVPADYRDAAAGTIDIFVNMHRATSPEERIGYLFLNPGGPGVSGVNLVGGNAQFTFPDEVLQRFDLIGFDPRGVGLSEPEFACGATGEQRALLATIEGAVDTPEEEAAGESAASLCIESIGPAGGRLHSEYVARDMDEIRKALGAEQISYLGYSYGSELGVWYATIFPGSVRAMVVDGAANPFTKVNTQEEKEEEGLEEIAAMEAQLEVALTGCGDPTVCPMYNDGDPIAYFMQAVSKLELVDRATAGFPQAGYLGILSTLYNQALWPKLWQGLFELNEYNDPAILLETASIQLLGSEPGVPRFTSHVSCLDRWVLHPESVNPEAQLAEESSETGDSDLQAEAEIPLFEAVFENTWFVTDVCQFYGQFAPDPIEAAMDGSATPILVVGNHSDPVTSFGESRELVDETLSNGYLLETDHSTHTVYPNNTCVNDHVNRVLINGVYPSERHVMCEREG